MTCTCSTARVNVIEKTHHHLLGPIRIEQLCNVSVRLAGARVRVGKCIRRNVYTSVGLDILTDFKQDLESEIVRMNYFKKKLEKKTHKGNVNLKPTSQEV